MNIEANATSSTTVVVRWGEVPREHCNGQIEGYKVRNLLLTRENKIARGEHCFNSK